MPEKPPAPLDPGAVEAYLRGHPDFLKKHPALLDVLTLPGRPLGGGVLDFQQYQLQNLQQNAADLQERYDSLVEFCRVQFSVQAQVMNAVLRLIATRSLESLLEALTLDLVALFNVDTVRLGLEAPSDADYQVLMREPGEGGIAYLPPGGVAVALAGAKKARLLAQTGDEDLEALSPLFDDCADQVASCALLKLDLTQAERPALLALASRQAGHFQPSHGVEMLSFLGQITAHQFDRHLDDLSV